METLQGVIRKACPSALWSKGVGLARDGLVTLLESRDDEIELRVSERGGMRSYVVSLFPDDEDWSCECDGRFSCCEHIAAAIIALTTASREGETVPTAEQSPMGHVGYRLDDLGGPLAVHRVVVGEGREVPIPGRLKAAVTGKIKAPPFVATRQDQRYEQKLGNFKGGAIPRGLVPIVMKILAQSEDVKFRGRPATIGPATSGLRLRIRDHQGGFLARIEQDPAVDEIFENAVIRRGDELCPLGEHGLPERHFEGLRRGRLFGPDDVGVLVGELLPLAKRAGVDVAIETARLPGSQRIAPRLHIETGRDGDALAVLPTIVYGDPPIVRLDGDRLTVVGDGEVPLRDLRREKILRDRVQETLGVEPGQRVSVSSDAAVDLASRLSALSESDAATVAGAAHRQFYDAGELTPQLELGEGGDFSLWFSPSEGGPKVRADGRAVVEAWIRGDSMAPLAGGGFGRIPDGFMAQHGHLVADLLLARTGKQDAASKMAQLPDLAALCQALDHPPPPSFHRLRALVEDFDALPPTQLPNDLRATLRDYQSTGVDWLSFLQTAQLGALLADDMGLGKTLQTLAVVRGRSLVVAPTSVIRNWADEAAKFRPGLRVATYHGPGRELDPDADLTITTYAVCRLDIETLREVSWDMVVLDEAQAIKNPESQSARAVCRLQARFRLALSGTPVENRVEELWSQFHFLNPGLLGGRSDFRERYEKPLAAGSAEAIARLRRRTGPFVLRRLKRDVAKELPPRTDVVLRCELDAEERQTYDAVRAATQDEVVNRLGRGNNAFAILEALLRLRQAACHRALVPGAPGHEDPATAPPSSKLRLLRSQLREAHDEGHKSLVFSQWTSLLDLCEPMLKTEGLSFVRLDGSTRDRGAVVDRFQSAEGPPVMLISLKAGGTGLNLTAADHVFLIDPWWNPAVEDQAADRAHRIGQERPVFVHRLVAEKTVEERILELQAKKRAIAAAAVGDGGGGAQITRDELLALLD